MGQANLQYKYTNSLQQFSNSILWRLDSAIKSPVHTPCVSERLDRVTLANNQAHQRWKLTSLLQHLPLKIGIAPRLVLIDSILVSETTYS